jgi:hypothetical protein
VVRSQTLNLAKLSTGSLASLLIALVLFALSASLWGFATGIDDAHISFYAAHALATTGEMLNYNGERVEQSSSLLHVLLTTLFARISNTNVVTVGYVIPMLAGWLCLPLLWVIARREQLTTATLLCTALPLVYWAHAGLETALFACLLLLYVYYLSLHAARWLALVLCGFALQLARPELPLFVPVLTLSFWAACRFLALPCRAVGSARTTQHPHRTVHRKLALVLLWRVVPTTRNSKISRHNAHGVQSGAAVSRHYLSRIQPALYLPQRA